MLHLDFETALLVWVFAGTLAHEYGHSFMARVCGCKTFGFFVNPLPGVLVEAPQSARHAILVLAGGWIFGLVSILLFLLFLVDPQYFILFLITTLAIETVLSSSDLMGIVGALFKNDPKDMWLQFYTKFAKGHNKMARFGLSKLVITNRAKYDEILKDLVKHGYSVAFFDNMGIKGWWVLVALLVMVIAISVALVNYPVFSILRLLGVEVYNDFSVLFWVLAGIIFVLSIAEYLFISFAKK